jgi:hypothetical protein
MIHSQPISVREAVLLEAAGVEALEQLEVLEELEAAAAHQRLGQAAVRVCLEEQGVMLAVVGKVGLVAAVVALETLAHLTEMEALAVSCCFGLRGTNDEKSMDRKQQNTRHCTRQSV